LNEIKIIINTANLHSGGGVQVAVSFIDELSRMETPLSSIRILASSEVHLNLECLNTDITCFASYEVFNTYGVGAIISKLKSKLRLHGFWSLVLLASSAGKCRGLCPAMDNLS
jgi:hypothetical protein